MFTLTLMTRNFAVIWLPASTNLTPARPNGSWRYLQWVPLLIVTKELQTNPKWARKLSILQLRILKRINLTLLSDFGDWYFSFGGMVKQPSIYEGRDTDVKSPNSKIPMIGLKRKPRIWKDIHSILLSLCRGPQSHVETGRGDSVGPHTFADPCIPTEDFDKAVGLWAWATFSCRVCTFSGQCGYEEEPYPNSKWWTYMYEIVWVQRFKRNNNMGHPWSFYIIPSFLLSVSHSNLTENADSSVSCQKDNAGHQHLWAGDEQDSIGERLPWLT